ncbi:hypothetical protein Scep_013797 [Stephania cephalantha]|uniref:Uncharacterized protein n=1 Tax=Stephania cephalantha TaxID=152367 RepID=A0AAP0J2K5_9MAGN
MLAVVVVLPTSHLPYVMTTMCGVSPKSWDFRFYWSIAETDLDEGLEGFRVLDMMKLSWRENRDMRDRGMRESKERDEREVVGGGGMWSGGMSSYGGRSG